MARESKAYKIDKQILEKFVNVPMLVKIEDDPRFPHFVVIICKCLIQVRENI